MADGQPDARALDRAALETISAELAELKSRMDVPAWKSPGNAIAALAFALSLFTSGFSIYSESVKDSHDLETDLATVTEKLAALPLNRADFIARHANGKPGDPGYLDEAHTFDGFQAETSMFAFEGYNLALKLGSSAATPELLEVSGALESINNYTKAIVVLKLALANADNWYQEYAARNDLEWALLTPPVTARMRQDADDVYADALTIPQRYPVLGENQVQASYNLTYSEMKWAEALMRTDCGRAVPLLQHASSVVAGGTLAFYPPLAGELEYDLRQCGAPPPALPAAPMVDAPKSGPAAAAPAPPTSPAVH